MKPTYEQVKSRFSYNPATGVLINIKTGLSPQETTRKKARISFGNRKYLKSAIIWLYMTEFLPLPSEYEVCYRDGDSRNHKWDNLFIISLTPKDGHQVCKRCARELPLKSFKPGKYYRSRICYSCTTTKKKTSKKARRKRLTGYNLTHEQYEQMVLNQQSRCKICLEIPEHGLVIDHCHRTKKVRGLLCKWCNLGIGYFKDLPVRLRSAMMYLQLSQEGTNV